MAEQVRRQEKRKVSKMRQTQQGDSHFKGVDGEFEILLITPRHVSTVSSMASVVRIQVRTQTRSARQTISYGIAGRSAQTRVPSTPVSRPDVLTGYPYPRRTTSLLAFFGSNTQTSMNTTRSTPFCQFHLRFPAYHDSSSRSSLPPSHANPNAA